MMRRRARDYRTLGFQQFSCYYLRASCVNGVKGSGSTATLGRSVVREGGSLADPTDVARSSACPTRSAVFLLPPASLLGSRSLCSRRDVRHQQLLQLPRHFRQFFSTLLSRRYRGSYCLCDVDRWLQVFLVSVCFD
ncbi:hypothetical protein T01_379 [Trichinella spiralis]|uniref:Uncharacterized protein n=1 Tax=Trichinella spiralis TaxID=6334 RepID=A0A0V1BGS3_TRISP|nr:hypothetical protein T01_379 [Trichinella spiralis]